MAFLSQLSNILKIKKSKTLKYPKKIQPRPLTPHEVWIVDEWVHGNRIQNKIGRLAELYGIEAATKEATRFNMKKTDTK